ncbi:hypothetical protein MUDAN_BIHEEGNE_01167 [Lactiplantibacillus mudanjiangensis]|uniref:nucleotidyltransferase family protein n=1 Tax=Lactiplantibacillus mudanjiangensis TaxID=1296538 RepID=UPI001014654E|nr:hypothetical protein MUDAN_BIHEEGNE_01167 [Lactiplantibacillus mudanjiangensis]
MSDDALVRQIILNNPELCQLLKIIQQLKLPQGALAAGSLRNTVWSILSQQPVVFKSDIDVVFFDPQSPVERDLELYQQLQQQYPQYRWQVKNEVYMHHYNFANQAPFKSVSDAIGHFVETPTCIGAYLDGDNALQLIAPHGLHDLTHWICRPVPYLRDDADHMAVFKQRIMQKNWQQQYPQLIVEFK